MIWCFADSVLPVVEPSIPIHRSPPSPYASAISFLFLVHSAGVFPCDSSHRLKSFILHPMLDGGLLDAHLQLRQPLADLLHPDVPAQDSQSLRHRLVEGFGGHLDRVLGAGVVNCHLKMSDD